MKKNSVILVLFIASILIWVFSKILPDIFLNSGKTAYEQGNYQEAYPNLRSAFILNHNNPDVRYYYIKTLIKLPPTLKIQKAIYELSQDSLTDSANLIAAQQISTWRNQIALNIGENYIEQAPLNGGILRWDVKKFPLKVSIENNSNKQLPEYYITVIQDAFAQWQRSTGNFIKFKLVDKSQNPDIEVKIAPQTTTDCKEQECKYVAAYTVPSLSGNLLKKMEITIYDTNTQNQPFSEKDLYNTTLHEIGHSLGIMGHSYNKDDLMYMAETSKNGDFDMPQSDFRFISSHDLNTLNLLYKLIPNITNTPLSEFDTSRQFFSPIVMGSNKQINSRKILEAQNYINTAPNLPNGYIDLASAYTELKEYNSALEALNKASDLSTNDSDRFIVYYNFAVIYMDIRDWDTSLKYAQMAKQIQPQSSDIDALIAGINSNRGNKAFAKESYLNTLENNPGSISDAVGLSQIYLQELNLVQAGRVLNNLIKANPDAKNDSRVKANGLLMFFFK